MTGAGKFLYGLALGMSLGIIGSKLVSAASPGPRRHAARRRPRTALRMVAKEREKQEASAR